MVAVHKSEAICPIDIGNHGRGYLWLWVAAVVDVHSCYLVTVVADRTENSSSIVEPKSGLGNMPHPYTATMYSHVRVTIRVTIPICKGSGTEKKLYIFKLREVMYGS